MMSMFVKAQLTMCIIINSECSLCYRPVCLLLPLRPLETIWFLSVASFRYYLHGVLLTVDYYASFRSISFLTHS